MFDEIVRVFSEHRNEENAAPMAAYMKNRFAFLGIKRPERSVLQKPFLKEARRLDEPDWDCLNRLWEMPEREYQYAALDLLVLQAGRLAEEDLDRVEKLITAKSWWDTVDLLATKVTGSLCSRFPGLIETHILPWSAGDNLWLSRTAILFQLKYKDRTDRGLLGRILEENSGTAEFFLNKAVGWALREYSKTDPEWARAFIRGHELSALSVREGSKYL